MNKIISILPIIPLIIFISFFLASCSSHIKRGDGPPNFYVDETKIPNARPRPVKLSRIGNKPYVVFGKRYYVMRSSKYYTATGIASWYGTMFHKRHTSSGEPYNMLAMTAAHRSLPLPTFVEVTNLKNHRKIIVKVNDRGPFHSNRIIDLSYVAAKKLGMLQKGTAPVRITAIDPYSYGKRRRFFFSQKTAPTRTLASSWRIVKKTTSVHSLYLQAGAFKNASNAKKLQKRLISLLKTNVIIVPPYAHQRLFRVKIGPFRDMATADRLTTRLKHLGIAVNRNYGA